MAVNDAGEISCIWVRKHGPALVTFGADGQHAVEIDVPFLSSFEIAVWADRHFVVASPRMRYSQLAQRFDPVSAWTFDDNGEQTGEGSLGDAIEHLLATAGGKLWVGYFDEGALSGVEPECHGLVRFNRDLRSEWTFPQWGQLGSIDDCYALNVSGETATAYSYSDFDIVQIRGDQGARWSGAPAGAHGLLTLGDDCVVVGGYEGQRDRVAHLTLQSNERVETRGIGRVRGLPADEARRLRVCRGPEMHVIAGTRWYRAAMR